MVGLGFWVGEARECQIPKDPSAVPLRQPIHHHLISLPHQNAITTAYRSCLTPPPTQQSENHSVVFLTFDILSPKLNKIFECSDLQPWPLK